ncbi:uncharacterized protein UHO2_00966 [Ustilago hordei]|uniref:uncharacterized protein n=1 Tax=Ustilago hordei TaxID=120017 RepID=UPI001A45FA27|nr:uncharacterized protein UHO2_00966 [Ustilago hordei]SYW74101.1 uncharacterized protein UHO2_00966 [Ustilago hordei]
MRRPTLHGNEFVSAERILQAALEDGPIGFMLLEEPPSSLPAFGFVPTGADKGVEMEVEVDKVVTAADIPKPYQHLQDVFDEVEADKLPHHTEHDLHLELIEGGKPPQGPLYLKGPKEMSELRRYLDENLEKGFIRPSKSPARSPVLFVPKKDGGLRLCVDYRGLNEITVKNRAPLPLIEEQLFLLRKAKIYTKLDLRAAYNLIQIAKGDEWKTAFGTQLGLYEYLVMPFGLANAPAHFQSFINDIFRDIIGIYVVVYCHGPGCSRSRRVMGSYGRSTGIEDLVDTSREHGRSAVSMETMDSYGLTCKGEPSHMRGGPGTATRRTKLKEQAQPRRGPSSDGYHSGARETRVLGHWQAGPEEEEQCRGSRHQVMRRRSSVEGVDTTQEAQGCQAGEAPEQYSMKKVLSGERAGAASLAML